MPTVTEKPATPTLAELPRAARDSVGRALGQISGEGGVQTDALAAAQALANTLSPAASEVVGRCLAQIAKCYEAAKSGMELKDKLDQLQGDYKLRLASTGEDISRRNREIERQVRNVLAILEGATRGVDPDKSALCLEVYRLSAESLFDLDVFKKFKEFLKERQKNQLKCDVGYNAVVLPLAIGDPSASNKTKENIAAFLDQLMMLGEELGVMFFVDVHSAGKSAFENDSNGPSRHDLGPELTQTLEELSWKHDGKHLGGLLKSQSSASKKAQYLVLSGGICLLAHRRNDPDFPKKAPSGTGLVLPTALAVSPSAIAAGLLAFSAADDNGVIGLPSGETPGKGATMAKLAMPPSDSHHELAREAGVNIPYLMSTAAKPTYDTSSTVQAADPKFQQQGRGSIAAVVMEQLIRRLVRRLLRRLPGNKNDTGGRFEYVVSKLDRILDDLVRRQMLRRFEVKDETTFEMEQRRQLKITVNYSEMAKLDTGWIEVERKPMNFEGTPEKI